MTQSLNLVRITAAPYTFVARLNEDRAPATCDAFLRLLPYRQQIIHARWSGEACWIPLGDFRLGVGPESPVHEPAPGEILFYPGGISETEILLPYGVARFACKDGPLEGSPFLTIVEGGDKLAALGRLVLLQGARSIVFELLA